MNLHTYLRLFIGFFFFAFWLSSCREDTIELQTFGQVRGTVLDKETGLPIADASVSTSPATSVLLTDANGAFVFTNVPAGQVVVRASKTGFASGFESVGVTEGDTSTVVLRLNLDASASGQPKVPAYLNPSNGLSSATNPLAFRWQKSTTAGAKYSVLVFEQGKNMADTLISAISDTFFVASNLNPGTDYLWQLLVTDPAGAQSFGPVWSFSTQAPPDNRVLFARNSSGNYSIWSCDQTGGQQRRLTPETFAAWRPRWNPQRTRIAFLSTKSGVDPHLFTMKPDGTDIQQVTSLIPAAGFNLFDLDFAWSPDGGQLLYMNQNRLYRIAVDGSGLAQFALAPIVGYTFSEVDWDPQSNQILARLTGQNIYESEFLLYNTTGALLSTVISDASGREGGPHFSPSGTQFIFTRDQAGLNTTNGRQLDSRILLRALVGGAATDVSSKKLAGTNDLDPRFSPTGARVIFTNRDNDNQGVSQIMTVLLNGDDRQVIVSNGEMADWR